MLLSAEKVKCAAREVGFHACGLARAEKVSNEREAELRAWLRRGENGEMDYLARNLEKRLDPRLLVDGVQTVVSVAVNYYPGDVANCSNSRLHLAKYAYGTDYHETVKQMLRRMLALLELEEGRDGRCFVDTAPVDEKYWAARCGLGWRGRNSQLIIPGMGSFFFLGELVLAHPADAYDVPCEPRCGTCRACVETCPMQALHGDGTLDARRCLSYLTIERRGEIPPEAQKAMGNCFYGCDRCGDVCPWNKRFASVTDNTDFLPRNSILGMTDEDWRTMDVERYREIFRKSAVKRAKFEGVARNINATTEP